MNAARPPEESVQSAEAVRREWVRPTVSRIAAGSAEDGANQLPDAGINPS